MMQVSEKRWQCSGRRGTLDKEGEFKGSGHGGK